MRILKYFLIGALGTPACLLAAWGVGEAAMYAAATYSWWPDPIVWIIICGSLFGGSLMIVALID